MINEKPNINYIQELSGGDISFEKKVIGIIKKEFPEEVKIYLNNYNLKKFKKAAENVHKIKHKISILGLGKSYEIAVVYEKNLNEGSDTLHEEFEQILQIMAYYLTTL